jgi:hypothetical protein
VSNQAWQQYRYLTNVIVDDSRKAVDIWLDPIIKAQKQASSSADQANQDSRQKFAMLQEQVKGDEARVS